jgi:hypothetical protein
MPTEMENDDFVETAKKLERRKQHFCGEKKSRNSSINSHKLGKKQFSSLKNPDHIYSGYMDVYGGQR